MKNRIAALSLTLALSVGLCAPAQAAESQTVQATLNAGITVTMDGTPQTFHDAQGAVVLPVTYNGTTYLPVRAVSALVGLGVEWEAETQTVKLTTRSTPTPATSPADGTGNGLTSQTVPALLNGSITVTLDGAVQTFHDAQGAVVLPLTYNGTTYLPVRAVCGLVGLAVDWEQETSTVKLGETPATSTSGKRKQLTDQDVTLIGGGSYADGTFTFKSAYVDGQDKPLFRIVIDVTGYEYLKVHGSGWFDLYDGDVKISSNFISKEDATINVAGRSTVTLVTSAHGESGDQYSLELVTYPTPEYIAPPAGALALTGDNVQSFRGTHYTDGKFIMECNGLFFSGSSITIKNSGYTTLTLTAKATADNQIITVGDTSGLRGKLLFTEELEAEAPKTYTVDITGASEIQISIRNGSLSDAEIYDMYLTK